MSSSGDDAGSDSGDDLSMVPAAALPGRPTAIEVPGIAPVSGRNRNMDASRLIAHCECFHASDDEDLRRFDPSNSGLSMAALFQDPRLLVDIGQNLPQVLPIKHNEARRACLQVSCWYGTALKRLGVLLRANTSLKHLAIKGNPRWDKPEELCLLVGLEANTSLRDLAIECIRLSGETRLRILAPFLADNPRLERLRLRRCWLQSADVDLVADQLRRRAAGTLVSLDLSENLLGEEIGLGGLVPALAEMRSVKRLNLAFNMIGRAGASSLAALLAGGASGLEELNLRRTAVDAEGALTLIDALADNGTLRTLNLSDNVLINYEGWESILKRVLRLVYNTLSIPSAMRSNHSLSSLSEPHDPGVPGCEEPLYGRGLAQPAWMGPRRTSLFDQSLGARACLLRASLGWNHRAGGNIALAARAKVLNLHILGRVDLGLALADAPIGVMPRVLAFYGGPGHWDAVFRLVRARTDLWER